MQQELDQFMQNDELVKCLLWYIQMLEMSQQSRILTGNTDEILALRFRQAERLIQDHLDQYCVPQNKRKLIIQYLVTACLFKYGLPHIMKATPELTIIQSQQLN